MTRFLGLFGLMGLCACGVPGGSLPGGDAGTGSRCEDVRECEDSLRCTSDTCSGGTCVRTTQDHLCDARPGGICAPDDPAANTDGCIYRACNEELCRENETRPTTCEVGECSAEDTCVVRLTCEEGESCCGDGTCQNCDDENPCTEDSCDGGSCINVPIPGQPCNDADPCTVTDMCDSGGACTGTVCEDLGDLECDPGRGCVGCTDDTDCPDDLTGYGACMFGAPNTPATCAGQRFRIRTTGTCAADMCTFTDTTESDNCQRDTGDRPQCNGDIVGGYGACNYADVCDENAQRTRTRTTFNCNRGSCPGTDSPESMACMRDTDGMACRDDDVPVFGACMFEGDPTCDTTGTQSRTRTVYRCATGSCDGMPQPETQACTRGNTNGMMCAPDQRGTPGPCVQNSSDTCAGTQTVDITSFACDSESCDSTVTPTPEACTIQDDTTTCGAVVMGAACSASPCVPDGLNSCTGTCTDTITTPTCRAAGCQNVITATDPRACDITAGTSCGPGSTNRGMCTQTDETCVGTQSVEVFLDECDGSGSCDSNSQGSTTEACDMPATTTCDASPDCDGMCNGSGVCVGGRTPPPPCMG